MGRLGSIVKNLEGGEKGNNHTAATTRPSSDKQQIGCSEKAKQPNGLQEQEQDEEKIEVQDFASGTPSSSAQQQGTKRRRSPNTDGYDDAEDKRKRSIVESQATAASP
ncbi:hypothetical protein KCU73_g13737, partial [Aureobasidium melanogenum]